MIGADKAAGLLFQQIEAPAGTFNTLAFSDENGEYIRVFIEPEYIGRIENIPQSYCGFPVRIEPRQQVRASVRSA